MEDEKIVNGKKYFDLLDVLRDEIRGDNQKIRRWFVIEKCCVCRGISDRFFVCIKFKKGVGEYDIKFFCGECFDKKGKD